MPTAPRHLSKAIRQDHQWYAQTEDLRWRRFEAWLDKPARAVGQNSPTMSTAEGKPPTDR
jgi:hypothetical protein